MVPAGNEGMTDTMEVLLAEDNLDHAVMVEQALSKDAGFELLHVRSGDRALQEAKSRAFDAIVIDHRLPDWRGLKLCETLRQDGFEGALLLVSAARSDTLAREVVDAGADGYLVKSDRFGQRLADTIRDALEDREP